MLTSRLSVKLTRYEMKRSTLKRSKTRAVTVSMGDIVRTLIQGRNGSRRNVRGMAGGGSSVGTSQTLLSGERHKWWVLGGKGASIQ